MQQLFTLVHFAVSVPVAEQTSAATQLVKREMDAAAIRMIRFIARILGLEERPRLFLVHLNDNVNRRTGWRVANEPYASFEQPRSPSKTCPRSSEAVTRAAAASAPRPAGTSVRRFMFLGSFLAHR